MPQKQVCIRKPCKAVTKYDLMYIMQKFSMFGCLMLL